MAIFVNLPAVVASAAPSPRSPDHIVSVPRSASGMTTGSFARALVSVCSGPTAPVTEKRDRVDRRAGLERLATAGLRWKTSTPRPPGVIATLGAERAAAGSPTAGPKGEPSTARGPTQATTGLPNDAGVPAAADLRRRDDGLAALDGDARIAGGVAGQVGRRR